MANQGDLGTTCHRSLTILCKHLLTRGLLTSLLGLCLTGLPGVRAMAETEDEETSEDEAYNPSTTAAEEPAVQEQPAPASAGRRGGVKAFTGMLETRKRQLVTSYYLYRGPAPSDTEMDAAIGAIDRLILQDYSLEDIWSTIFHILISEPGLAHNPFEEVIPPNIHKAHYWREDATPVKVVVEEHYPEFDFLYKRAQMRRRTWTYCGAGAFIPSYTLSIAFGAAEVGSLYDQARDAGLDVSAAAAFLPVIPLVGPILTQSWMDRQASALDDANYDAGTQLVGAVWGTLLQTVGLTAMIIGASTRLPEPFGDRTTQANAGKHRRGHKVGFTAAMTPTGFGMRLEF